MKNRIKYLLALSLIKGVGDTFIKKQINVIELYIGDINLMGNMLGGKVTVEGLQECLPMAEEIIDECSKSKIKIVSLLCDGYPQLLKEIKNPPPILYMKGRVENLDRCIGVIGSRKSGDLGNKIASRIGSYFSQNWSVCNGLVDGIDKNAIYNKVSVLNNVTGVLSGGLNFNITSSKTTRFLAEEVLKNNGLLISENPPNKKEDQFSGSKASRIQAGLSRGLVLVESSIDGGSKFTIKSFSELNRVLGVISYPGNTIFENEDRFSGNRLLIKSGIRGISLMCDIRKETNIKTKTIIEIKSKSHYQEFEKNLL